MKDEKIHHSTVDEPSSEQQFHKSNVIITFVVWKNWIITILWQTNCQAKYW